MAFSETQHFVELDRKKDKNKKTIKVDIYYFTIKKIFGTFEIYNKCLPHCFHFFLGSKLFM